MANHDIFLTIDHKIFAVMVVICMALAGLASGIIIDFIMHRFGLQIIKGDRK